MAEMVIQGSTPFLKLSSYSRNPLVIQTHSPVSYQIGMKGESLSLHSLTGVSNVEWVEGKFLSQRQPLTWYKVSSQTFDFHIKFL